MFIEVSTIFAVVVGGGFLVWLYLSEEAAKKKQEDRERESERRHTERELMNAKQSAEKWRELARHRPDDQNSD